MFGKVREAPILCVTGAVAVFRRLPSLHGIPYGEGSNGVAFL